MKVEMKGSIIKVITDRESIEEFYNLLQTLKQFEEIKKEISRIGFVLYDGYDSVLAHNLPDDVVSDINKQLMLMVLGEIDNQIDAIKDVLNLED